MSLREVLNELLTAEGHLSVSGGVLTTETGDTIEVQALFDVIATIGLDRVVDRHGGDYWQSESDQYPKSDWKYEVENGDTLSGYWDWLRAKLEADSLLM